MANGGILYTGIPPIDGNLHEAVTEVWRGPYCSAVCQFTWIPQRQRVGRVGTREEYFLSNMKISTSYSAYYSSFKQGNIRKPCIYDTIYQRQVHVWYIAPTCVRDSATMDLGVHGSQAESSHTWEYLLTCETHVFCKVSKRIKIGHVFQPMVESNNIRFIR